VPREALDPAGSLGAEVGWGSVGYVGGVGLGVGITCVLVLGFNDGECPTSAALVGLAFGAATGIAMAPMVVAQAGDASGGTGSTVLSVLGSVGFALAGGLVLRALDPQEAWMALPAVAGIGVLSVTGSVLCYRWSSDDAVTATVVPTPGARGAQLVLHGRL
jgi:hypothetical protein